MSSSVRPETLHVEDRVKEEQPRRGTQKTVTGQDPPSDSVTPPPRGEDGGEKLGKDTPRRPQDTQHVTTI